MKWTPRDNKILADDHVSEWAKPPIVSIVIVSSGKGGYLRRCLESLLENTEYPGYNVVVVVNQESGKAEALRKGFHGIDILETESTWGFSSANNLGIKHALSHYRPGFVFLLNDDTELTHKTWLKELVAVARRDPKVGIVGCKTVHPDGSIEGVVWRYTFAGNKQLPVEEFSGEAEVAYVIGAAFLIRVDIIMKIGLLDQKFDPAYYEENDYCQRARSAGFKVMYTSRSEILHFGGGTTRDRPLYYSYIYRANKVRFILLNFPPSWILVRLPSVILDSLSLLRHSSRELKERHPGPGLSQLPMVYWSVFRDARDIISKRRCRERKIWYPSANGRTHA